MNEDIVWEKDVETVGDRFPHLFDEDGNHHQNPVTEDAGVPQEIEDVITEEHAEHVTTPELLVQQYDSLKYYNSELKLKDKDILYAAYHDERIMMFFVAESLFVNKMNTIANIRNWEEANKSRSDFQRFLFRNKVTDPKAVTDNFGNITRVGIKMSPEELATYEAAYLIIFEEILHDGRTSHTALSQ
jgi:hypothetical protein